MKKLENTVEINTDLIKIEGCLPYLGCTIILSGKDMDELKKVKHALKKILRFSRQLYLENEYLNFLGLSQIQKEDSKTENESPFLHSKHMERQFLIFKELSYSKRGKNTDNMIEDDDEGEADEKLMSDIDKMAKLNEKEV